MGIGMPASCLNDSISLMWQCVRSHTIQNAVSEHYVIRRDESMDYYIHVPLHEHKTDIRFALVNLTILLTIKK